MEERDFNLYWEASRQLHVDEVLQFLITADQPFTLDYISLKRLSTKLLGNKTEKKIQGFTVYTTEIIACLFTDAVNRNRLTEGPFRVIKLNQKQKGNNNSSKLVKMS